MQQSTGAGSLATAAGTGRDERWLFGPAADLTLGCGLGYAVFAALLLAPNASRSLAPWIPFAIAVIGLVTNTPH